MEFAKGGLVPEPLSIPVTLCNGYYYITSETIDRYGAEILDKLNEMKVGK